MDEFRREKYIKKAAQGTIWLVIKRVIIQVIFTVSNIFLARLLFPSDFGTYAIVVFAGILFNVFSDLGFGPSLIQKKDKLDVSDLRTSFSAHLILSLFVVIIFYFSATYISDLYHIEEKGKLLMRLYSLVFLFGPFKTVSGAILERKLAYHKTVSVELIEGFFVSFSSVIFAYFGYGVFSFVFGSLVGHLISSILYFILSPWPVGFSVNLVSLKALLKFGFSYQMNVIFSLFYGPLALLYLGKVVGSVNLGYYQFAMGLSVFPIAFSESINRIIFPLGARTQEDREFFKKIVDNSLLITSFISLPITFMLFASATSIIQLIYTDKWLPALPAVYLGLIQMGVVAFTGLFSQLLFSLGKVDIIKKMGFVWAILTIILAPIFIHYFNFIGMSITTLIVSLSGIWFYFMLKREVEFTFFRTFFACFVSAFVAGLVVNFTNTIWPYSFPGLVLRLGLGLMVYLVMVLVLNYRKLYLGVKMIFDVLKFS